MSYRLAQAALHSPAKGWAQHILIAMADIANDKQVEVTETALVGSCYPSEDYLGRLTGYSRATIYRALQKLKQLKLIDYESRRGVPTTYTLHLPRMPRKPMKSLIETAESPIETNKMFQTETTKSLIETAESLLDTITEDSNIEIEQRINIKKKKDILHPVRTTHDIPPAGDCKEQPPPAGAVQGDEGRNADAFLIPYKALPPDKGLDMDLYYQAVARFLGVDTVEALPKDEQEEIDRIYMDAFLGKARGRNARLRPIRNWPSYLYKSLLAAHSTGKISRMPTSSFRYRAA